MTYKDILFHAFEGEAGQNVQAAAIGLAKKQGAQVTGISVVDNTPIPSYVVPYVPANLGDTYLEEARRVAKSLLKQVEEAGRQNDVKVEWRYVEGDIRGVINLHSRYTDIVVLGQGAGDDVPIGPALNLADDLILSSSKPILSIPWQGDHANFGDTVVVAWNSSAQSSRAVQDALPILTNAAKVHVLTVGEENPSHLPGAEITAHLVRHGVNAEAAHLVRTSEAVGETILNYVAETGSDMIVCGGWGHSRLLETVMGGVTRHLLRHMTVPVLMSH
ncbi:MAG: universal stress protein [Alphaproteobacteria bacterium]|nr:MAG: universal stress protein [Alphaproteobacteria bacterium]